MTEAWWARRQIFSLAADRAVLGACTGLALFAIWMGGGGSGCACGGSWVGVGQSWSRRRGPGPDMRAGCTARTIGATAN